MASHPQAAEPASAPRATQAALTVAALGVVYGDIGTSPLYTVKEIFAPATGVPLDALHLVGAVSVIVWTLLLVVSLKYVLLVLRADHHGEGGALALAARVAALMDGRPAQRAAVLALGVTAATLFYGDSLITPAISVLGAMEGLAVASPALAHWALPATVLILTGLFLVQRFGTARVGTAFGPIIALWFLTLALTGIVQIVQTPAILAALNPLAAVGFLVDRGPGLLLVMGAIVLAVTGAEALYADLGHFGRKPIARAWSFFVFPALAVHYLGQGALLMADPAALQNPFYRMFPAWALWPALGLATLAAIIASQAVISGAYSVTRQAMQLGFLPRMTVRHTSAAASGQIYMPAVNTALLLGVLAAVLGYGSSSALAAAYGIAVTLTMGITGLLVAVLARRAWRWPRPLVGLLLAGLLALDGLMIAGCLIKFADGGWFPLALGGLLGLGMALWARGRQRLLAALRRDGLALDDFVAGLAADPLPRIARTAVYPSADAQTVPQALLHNLKHHQHLHARNLVLTVRFADTPWVPAGQRLSVQPLGQGFWRVGVAFGFMEVPDLPQALDGLAALGLPIEPAATSYFLSRETLLPQAANGPSAWADRAFAAMSRQARGVAGFFCLPEGAVVELGTRLRL